MGSTPNLDEISRKSLRKPRSGGWNWAPRLRKWRGPARSIPMCCIAGDGSCGTMAHRRFPGMERAEPKKMAESPKLAESPELLHVRFRTAFNGHDLDAIVA